MKKFIKQLLREGLSMPAGKPVKDVNLSDSDKRIINSLSWKDIDFEQLNEESPVNLRVILPIETDVSSAISLEIQLSRIELYQPHLFISDSLRGLGLGYKIYVALVHTFGHLYSAKGRRLNDVEIPRIWSKLKSEPGVSCLSNSLGDLCVSNDAENSEEMLNHFSNL